MRVFENNSNIFQLLTESIAEGIIIVNSKQEIVASNNAAERMFGYDKEELNGQDLNTIIPKQYRSTHKGHVRKFVDNNEKRRMGEGRNIYGLMKSGEEFPLEAGLTPFGLYGETFVMALVSDITFRKKTEAELSHWFRIFEESLNEIYVFDAESLKFLNVNRGALKNMGFNLQEMQAMTPVDIKPDYTERSFKKVIDPLLQKEKEKLQFETIHQRKDGSCYPVEAHLQLSKIGKNSVIVAIILDITERKSYTEKLEKTVAERTKQLEEALAKEKELGDLKTKFLSLVSHEFKTPLSSILTSTTLLGKYTETEQQTKRDKHLETIRSKVKYLDAILNDFLSVERLESGKVNYNYTEFSLSKVINEVVYDSNMLLKEGQKINYPHNIDDIVLVFDEKILELVLSNLIHNAIKYSPENKEISIKVKSDANVITLSIADQGIGIPEEEQKFVFDRYFRAKNALLTQGTGIGLNIAKRHLENLGGTITFKSTKDQGSEFTVVIPKKDLNEATSFD